MRTCALVCALAATACGFDPAGGRAAGAGGDGGGGGDVDASGGGAADGASGPDVTPLDAAVEGTARVVCPTTDVVPVIDALALGPWLEATFETFAVTDAQLRADEHESYEDDAVVSFACLHDANYLYLFFDVADLDILNDSVSPREDDAIVVFLDGAGDLGGPYGDDDHALALGTDEGGMDYGASDVTGSVAATATENVGYRIEVEIDKPSIADTLAGEIGFNLAVVDDDGWSNNERDIFALRHVPDDQEANACPNCCEGQAAPWCDTRIMGILALE